MKNAAPLYFLGFYCFVVLIGGLFFFFPVEIIDVLAPKQNRELGLIETLQALLLIMTIATLYAGIRNQQTQKFLSIGAIGLLSFILLEEIDYGLHYAEFILNKEPYAINFFGFRNIHNQGELNDWIKTIILIPQLVFFGVFPFINFKIRGKTFHSVYGYFYWSVMLAYLFYYAIGQSLFSDDTIQLLDDRQIFAETKELALYLLLFVFIKYHGREFLYKQTKLNQ